MLSNARHATVALASLLCLSAIGCETIHTVSRQVTLQSLPATASVEAALRAAPGVQSVWYERIPAQTSWSLYKGTIHDPPYDQFSYSGNGAYEVLEIKQTSDGGKTLYISRLWMNHVPTRDEVERARALMDGVYATLRAYNPELPPAASVTETLRWIPGR